MSPFPGECDTDHIAGPDPAMTPYVPLCLGFEIRKKMFAAEVKTGITLE